jgi:type IV secretory pathway ATPase VirB11/archaellum biosynthesis ATPase
MMSTQQNAIVVGATSAGKTTSHQELLALCLRRVPDRFIVGEVTNPEALRGLFNLGR